MRTICILAAIISTLFTSLFAQDVVINGYASLAKNSKVYAFEVIDEITNQRSLLTQTIGNDEGNFSLKIPVKKTKSIIICTGNGRTRMWVDPAQKYTLTFLQPDTTITQNGFVQFWESRIECESNVATNALIGVINIQIANFISSNTYDYLLLKSNTNKAFVQRIRNKNPQSDLAKFGESKDSSIKARSNFYESLSNFETTIKSDLKLVLEQNSFIENYLFCKLSQLKLLTSVTDSYEDMSTRIDLSNPAFCEWVEIFASNYLQPNLNRTEKQTFDSLLQVSMHPEEIINFLNQENKYNLQLDELVFLAALREKYYANEWSSALISRLNQNVIRDSKFESSKILGKNLAQELSEKSQTEISDFTLIDDQGEKWVFGEQCNRNMYLYFFRSSKSSQRDLALLNQLSSKYKNDFHIIAIGMQNSYEEYEKAIKALKLPNIITLYGGNDYRLIEGLGIQSVPYAIQTNSKKKISFNYTPLPSEGIQVKWDEILRKSKK